MFLCNSCKKNGYIIANNTRQHVHDDVPPSYIVHISSHRVLRPEIVNLCIIILTSNLKLDKLIICKLCLFRL
jgi:hypothetical protein